VNAKKLLVIYVFFVLFTVLGISNANAGQLYRNVTLKIVGIQDDIPGGEKIFWVKTSSGPYNISSYPLPSCHTGPSDRVVWDLNDVASKAALSLALAAYTTGKIVEIDAYDTCINGMATVRNLYFSETQ